MEIGSRVSQIELKFFCERIRAAEDAPRNPCRLLERRHGLAALLYLEWLGLTAPELDILATPELMALVKQRPPWSYESYSSFQLYFTKILARFLPCGTGGEFSIGHSGPRAHSGAPR